jgi:hypothetical protein
MLSGFGAGKECSGKGEIDNKQYDERRNDDCDESAARSEHIE